MAGKQKDKMVEKLKDHFYESQHSVTSHEKLSKHMKQLYDKMPLADFVNHFTNCLKVPLVHGEKHRVVENTLNFAAKFVASLLLPKPNASQDDDNEDEEEMPPFVLKVLNFLFENHQTENQAIRFRVCQFINKVLFYLGNEACLDDTVCDQICDCMMERLQDKAPVVRMQAVLALHRLQDPSDVNCPVMKAFMFHMATDPNADVRRAIITNIAITNQSIRSILERTHDVKDSVRRTAYVTLSKLGVQRFTIIQRVRLLTDGLKDHSAIVRDSVSKIMLPSWLQYYKGSLPSLLHALDCENSTEISTLALKTLFGCEPIKNVLEQLTKLLNEDKVIPADELNPDTVLFWRVLSEYLDAHPEIANDCPIEEPIPEILPELTTFCNYIKQFFEDNCTGEAEHWVKLQQQFILTQLLELCKGFDLADEMGRTNLRNLCLYLLTNNNVSEDVVPVVVEVMVRVVPDVEDRLQALAEAISEVREPMTEQEPEPSSSSHLTAEEVRQRELKQANIKVKINELTEEQDEAIRGQDFLLAQKLKEEHEKLLLQLKALSEIPSCPSPVPKAEVRDPVKDRAALCKCLRIVREMVQSDTVKCLSATLRSLMQNFVLPCLQEDNSPIIRNKALEALGLFCLLDVTLAKENFVMFCFQIASDEVCEIALKVTFDLLHLYGLETFQIQEENNDSSTKKKSKKKKNLFVTDMYDDEFDTEEEENQESHTITSSGSSGNTSNLISMLTSLLDSASISMRNLAMEGLYKLLYACRITSSALLSRLVVMWYSPVTEGDETLRQPLGAFLTLYASQCPRSQETLEQAFLPTLRTLMQAPVTSPLTQIDQESVARLFISLTRPGINKFHSKTSHIHNNLALSICNEIMDCDDTTNIGVLIRALTQLELSLEDAVYREDLKNLIKMLSELFKETREKQFLRSIEKLKQMIENAQDNVSIQTAEVDNTAATSQFGETESHISNNTTNNATDQNLNARSKNSKLLHPHMHTLISQNEMEMGGDEDDDDDSQKLQSISGISNVVIPASPPRNQSSEEEPDDDVFEKENPKSNKTDNSRVTNTANVLSEDKLFKHPPDRKRTARTKKTQNTRVQQESKPTSESDVDSSSPAPKKRKGDEQKEKEEPSKSNADGKRQTAQEGRKPVKNKNHQDKSEQKQVAKGKGKKIKDVADNASPDHKERSVLPQPSSSKRLIHPTEKGSTLKTFQNIQLDGTRNSTSPVSSPSNTASKVSNSSTSPLKQTTKASQKKLQSSESEVNDSTCAQQSSGFSSPMKTPPNSKLRRSVTFESDRQSLESPPESAAKLNKKLAKGNAKSLKSQVKTRGVVTENTAESGHPSSPTRRSSNRVSEQSPEVVSRAARKRTAQESKSSSSGPDTDSSPIPVTLKGSQRSKGNPLNPILKKPAPSPISSSSDGNPEVSPLPTRRSGRKKGETPSSGTSITAPSSETSITENLDSSTSSVGKQDRHPLRSNKLPEPATLQPKKKGAQHTTYTSSEADSDFSPRPATRRVRTQVKGVDRLEAASSGNNDSIASSQSVSSSDTAKSKQHQEKKSRLRRLSDASPTSGNENSPDISAAQLKKNLQKKVPKTRMQELKKNSEENSTESDASPSPTRRSSSRFSGGSPEVTKLMTKKRPAQALQSVSSETDSNSPSSSMRRGKNKNSESDSPIFQPVKKIQTTTPRQDSPMRRSLRSVTTPSPRTRSGKV